MSAASIDFREFGNELLTGLLEFAVQSIPGALGAGLSVAADAADEGCLDTDGDTGVSASAPRTVAAVGVATELDPAQWRHAASPLWQAFRTGDLVQIPEPIETATPPSGIDLAAAGRSNGPLADGATMIMDRTLDTLIDADPAVLDQVKGAVFSAGEWGGELPVVLSVYLDRPADARILRDIDRYEPVITQALSVVEYCAGEQQVAQQMLQMTQYRRVIEQAKGLVMGAVGADAGAAFATLARASQHFNVRLRHLAVALVEHVGDGTAEHPDDPDLMIRPTENERVIAGRVWAALTTSAILPPSGPGSGPALR